MEQTTKTVAQTSKGGKRAAGGTGKKPLLVLIGIVAVLAAAYLGLCAYASGLDTIFPNRTIRDIEVGGLTVNQAAEKLAAEFPQQTFTVTPHPEEGEAEPLDIPYSALGASLDYETAARTANREFADQSFIRDGWDYLLSLFGASSHNWYPLDVDETVFSAGYDTLVKELTYEPVATAYEANGDHVLVTTALNGRAIDEEETSFRDQLLKALPEESGIDVTLKSLPAEVLSAQQIHDAIAGDMKNAGYDMKTKSIIPERVGADFDVEEAQSMLDEAKPGEKVSIPAKITLPAVTADYLKSVLFRDVLGSCTTTVRGSSARKNNVRLASSSFNGYVLNSGDTFSYNGVVGKRTTAKGYQAAPAYVQGETVDEVGGGVCQPSSTLYLACLRADMKIKERYAHRYIPSYIPAGMDATVSWGGPDFKFTNNTDFPVKILTSYTNGQLTIKLLGTNVKGTSVKITNKHLSTTPYKEVVEIDPNMAPGTQKVKTTPYVGHKYETYRHRYDKNGKLISSTFEASSNYKSRNRVIVKGPDLPAGQQPVKPSEGGAKPGSNPTPTPVFPSPKPETPAPTPAEPENPGFIIIDPDN